MPVTIYVPHGNSVEKNQAMRAFGANLVEHGEDFQAAREEAERRARHDGLHIRAGVPSRPGEGRRDLRARTACARRRTSTCSMCRSGRAPASAAASWRVICSGLETEIVGVQSTEAPSYALSFAAGTVVDDRTAAKRWPTAWRRACPIPMRSPSFARAPRASCRSATMKSAPRSAPTGPIRTTSPKAPAPLRWPRPCRKRPGLRGKRVGLILSGGNIDFDLFNRWVVPEAADVTGGKVLV